MKATGADIRFVFTCDYIMDSVSVCLDKFGGNEDGSVVVPLPGAHFSAESINPAPGVPLLPRLRSLLKLAVRYHERAGCHSTACV